MKLSLEATLNARLALLHEAGRRYRDAKPPKEAVSEQHAEFAACRSAYDGECLALCRELARALRRGRVVLHSPYFPRPQEVGRPGVLERGILWYARQPDARECAWSVSLRQVERIEILPWVAERKPLTGRLRRWAARLAALLPSPTRRPGAGASAPCRPHG